MEIYERVQYLRKEILKITQDEFAKKIRISRSNLGSIETGRVHLTDRVISDICDIFAVNETWLKEGGSDDNMFVQLSPVEEVAAYTQDILDSVDDDVADFVKNFIVVYGKLDDNSKSVLKQFAKDMLERTKKDQDN